MKARPALEARPALGWAASAAVAVATVLLLVVAFELSETLLAPDASFVVARDGAEVAVRDGALYVSQGSAGMVSRAVLAVFAGAFAVLTPFAVVGCRSILRRGAGPSAA